MKRSQPRRDWSRARAKLEAEGACRVCGSPHVEAAHVIGRELDPVKTKWKWCDVCQGDEGGATCDYCDGQGGEWLGTGKGRVVLPEAVVPLCPVHHRAYDAHRLDLLPYLTGSTGLEEQVRAVRDAGGIVAAYERTTGHRWRAEAA